MSKGNLNFSVSYSGADYNNFVPEIIMPTVRPVLGGTTRVHKENVTLRVEVKSPPKLSSYATSYA